MFHLFKSAANRTLTLTLMAVVLLGLLLGAVRLVLPFADLFRSQLEDVLSDALGLEVRVSEFRVRLAGTVPRVTLEDVTLLDTQTGRPQLDLMELRLDLDLAATLLERAPRVESLTLVGAHLVMQRREDGSIAIAGLQGIKGNDPRLMTFFLANGRFLLIDSEVDWIDSVAESAPLSLSDVQIRFDNTATRHHIGLHARVAGDPASRLRLAADLRGDPADRNSWTGDVFLDWRGGDLGPTVSRRLAPGLHIATDIVTTQSWLQISHSAVINAVVRISAGGLSIRPEDTLDDAATLRLERLGGMLRWQREAAGWRLDLAHLIWDRAGVISPETSAGVRLVRGARGEWILTGGIDWLRLSDLSALLPLISHSSPVLTAVQRAQLSGDLTGLRLRVAGKLPEPLEWAVRGRIEDLQLQADGRRPGLSGLDVAFVSSQDQGYVELDGEALAVDLPWLFEQRSPLRFERLSGDLFWQKGGDGALHIEGPALALENEDIRTRTRLALTVPASGSPFLDLQADFSDGEVSAIRHYLPGAKLKDRLERWLERAFVAGRVPWGSAIFRGRPSDFPFREDQGRFEVLLRADDAVVRFREDWPPLTAGRGVVRFDDSSLEVAASGRLFDSEITHATVQIPDLFAAHAVNIAGSARGPFGDLKRLATQTPLRRHLGRIATAFHPDGRSRIDIRMDIPLKRSQTPPPLVVQGALSWPEPATLTIADTNVTLTDLRGAVSFTKYGLSRSHVEAQLWDSPVDIDIQSHQDKPQGQRSTQVTVEGHSQIQLLAQQFPHTLWDLVRGGGDWRLGVQIPTASAETAVIPLAFSLHSDLRGISVELPAPLGKVASQTRPLGIEGRLAPGQDLAVRGRYGDLGLSLGLMRGEDGSLRLARGALALNDKPPPLSQAQGVTLSGQLPTLDLTAWADWLGQRPSGTGGGVAVRSVDLRIDRLHTAGLSCTDVHLNLERRPGAWEIDVEAEELAGNISVPVRARQEPIRVELNRADIQGLLTEPQAGAPIADKQNGQMDPRRFPTLDLRVDQLRWGENELGRLEIGTQAIADGLELTQFELDAAPLMTVRGTGRWVVRGGTQETAIDLTAKGSDLGEFLRSLDYESVLHQAPAIADLELAWSGGPGEFSPAGLSGKVSAEVGKGSLLEVEPGVGRMLGVLNLGALQRRLRLDFSDLFQRGFAFEKMAGDFTIASGQARIDNLVIEGPSALVRISGSADLVEQRFDQVVTVTPSVGTGVALASAVAGGPLVGAAVLIADRIAGGAVDKLVSYQYDVTGPWTDPDIRRRGLTGDATSEQPFLPADGRAGAEQQLQKGPPGAATKKPSGTKEPSKASSRPEEPAKNLFLPGH